MMIMMKPMQFLLVALLVAGAGTCGIAAACVPPQPQQ